MLFSVSMEIITWVFFVLSIDMLYYIDFDTYFLNGFNFPVSWILRMVQCCFFSHVVGQANSAESPSRAQRAISSFSSNEEAGVSSFHRQRS